MSDELPNTRELLIGQTGKVQWHELQRAFAQGILHQVQGDQDLVAVAEAIVNDDAVQISAWLSEAKIRTVSDEQAKDWLQRDPLLWAVVAAPWVLVQERG